MTHTLKNESLTDKLVNGFVNCVDRQTIAGNIMSNTSLSSKLGSAVGKVTKYGPSLAGGYATALIDGYGIPVEPSTKTKLLLGPTIYAVGLSVAAIKGIKYAAKYALSKILSKENASTDYSLYGHKQMNQHVSFNTINELANNSEIPTREIIMTAKSSAFWTAFGYGIGYIQTTLTK
jgi:hypothetical protein